MKKSNKIILIISTIIICIIVYFVSINIYKSEKNSQTAEELISEEKLYDIQNYPKVDSSIVTQNLAAAFIENFTAETNIDQKYLNYSNTHTAYQRLINNDVDLIISKSPSKSDFDLAKEKKVEFDLIPIVKDAIVFFVNSDNPVDNITTSQLQEIYSGTINNWKILGGNDESILAYQNPEGTDIQNEMSSVVMKELTLSSAPVETLSENSQTINNFVSNYKNDINAIGYSSYIFANSLYSDKTGEISPNMKLLSIDGISPTAQSIKDGSYPFITYYYIVVNKDDYSNFPSRILAEQMQSSRGKKIIENAGFIPAE